MSYIQGLLLPCPADKKEEYLQSAKLAGPIFMEYGALAIMEAWGDHIEDGKVTDFKLAVKAEESENVVLSWVIWPDKDTYMAAFEKMENDPRWAEMPEMVFDTKRMMWAGFEPILELKA